jgi:hypothetical protein
VDGVLDELVVEYKRGGRKGTPREVNAQMQSHLKRVREYFGAMRAMAVHKQHVNGFIEILKAERKQNATVNRSLQLLGQAYKLAVTADPPILSRALTVPKLEENNVRKGKFSNDEPEAISLVCRITWRASQGSHMRRALGLAKFLNSSGAT